MVLFLIYTDGPFLDTHGQWKVEYSVWAESAIYNIYIFVCYISIIFSWYCGQLYVRTGRISNQAGHQQRVFCQPDSQLYEQATQTQLLLLSFLISLVKHCHSLLFIYLYIYTFDIWLRFGIFWVNPIVLVSEGLRTDSNDTSTAVPTKVFQLQRV